MLKNREFSFFILFSNFIVNHQRKFNILIVVNAVSLESKQKWFNVNSVEKRTLWIIRRL
ncbi:hypothetical protein [Chishuiella sp.]|uniref:hypothetical protein n=1 Tax=Chishuiella sp. TaxID=1969467 RepID=UPI0028B0CC30|nr:hypothetical protein [Chishuiella sp.]